MKITTAAAVLLVGTFATAGPPQAPGIEGHWSGAVVRENAVQLVDPTGLLFDFSFQAQNTGIQSDLKAQYVGGEFLEKCIWA